jgi:hypothetical protein
VELAVRLLGKTERWQEGVDAMTADTDVTETPIKKTRAREGYLCEKCSGKKFGDVLTR